MVGLSDGVYVFPEPHDQVQGAKKMSVRRFFLWIFYAHFKY